MIMKQITSGERPKIKEENISKEMEQIIRSCWKQEPEKRPSFEVIHQELLKEIDKMIERKEIKEEEIQKFLEYCKIEYDVVENKRKALMKRFEEEYQKKLNLIV